MKRLHAFVRGRVQGVGFRAATVEQARRIGLRGWVRNRLDESVEVVAEGGEPELRKLESFLRVGPRLANVTALEVHWEEPQNDLVAFGVR
jgi:acylphosphatase